jgi:hypothetical protein
LFQLFQRNELDSMSLGCRRRSVAGVEGEAVDATKAENENSRIVMARTY